MRLGRAVTCFVILGMAPLSRAEVVVEAHHPRDTACGASVTQTPEGMQAAMQTEPPSDGAELSEDDRAYLAAMGWGERVGDALGVWVSVERQMLYIIADGRILWQAPCATAAAGTGQAEDSLQTPLGWHRVVEKFGEGAPWGQVFESRRRIDRIWHPGENTSEDLVLTRILWLDGEEPGRNKGVNAQGVNVDSRARHIYLHGTNDEARVGIPSSHGCIRLRNDDVIAAFERIPVGTRLLISERALKK